VTLGREAQPSAGIIDSQRVKTTGVGGARGYDGAKQIKSRKRHLLVDTQGLVRTVNVHPADVRLMLRYRSGWPLKPILRLCVQRLNQVKNSPRGAAPTLRRRVPDYQEFARVVDLIGEL
jgi:hypothetical protein